VPEYNDATWFTMLFSCSVSTLYNVYLPTIPNCDEVGSVPEYNGALFCKVGNVPEYNDATWFTMLFSCGVSTLYTVNLPIYT
jgi:hypothetical protein